MFFYGYTDVNSTKREWKQNGHTKTSVHINFDENTTTAVQQEHFLANDQTDRDVIREMTAASIETSVVEGMMTLPNVRCGLDKATLHTTVIMVGEDVDLIVLLIGLAPPSINIIFMRSVPQKTETKLFSVKNTSTDFIRQDDPPSPQSLRV